MAATALGNRKRSVKDAPMMPVPTKDGAGRPTLYKPEYCDIIETLGKQGKSRMQMASILNVDRKTLERWAGDFEEFGSSLARAMAHAQAWWEGKAQSSLGKKQFQAQLWRYSMAGRFKEDYAEQRNAGIDITLNLANLVESSLGDLAKPVDAKVIDGASSLPAQGGRAKESK